MIEQADLITLGLGEQLRIARVGQGIELHAAAAATRLSEKNLQIIEAEQWERLPAVYRTGYARNYAAYLGVSLDEHAEELRKISSQELPQLQSVFLEGIKINKMDTNLRVLSYAVMSIFVVLPLIWAYTKTAANLSQPNTIAISGQTNNRTNQTSLNIAGQSGSGGQQTSVPKHMEANVVPTQSLGSKNNSIESAGTKDNLQPGEVAQSTMGSGSEQILEVLLKADSWVVVTDATGKRLEYDLLRGGSSYSYAGSAPFDILIGRASAVELKLNGKQVDLGPHSSGNVASLELGVVADPEG
jgi:cytoskeleton protein RodZ